MSRKIIMAALAAASIGCVTNSGAIAQDFGATPAFSWTGLHVGAHGVYAWDSVGFPISPAPPAGPPRPDLEGGGIGAQIGFDYQINSFVIGAVADLTFVNLEKTVRDGNYLTETAKIDRFGTVRALLGYAHANWLFFGTIGLGWADVEYGATCPAAAAVPFGGCGQPGPRSYKDSLTAVGWAYGGGVKYAINDQFSIGSEYIRLDLDDETFTNGPLASFPVKTEKISNTMDVVKVFVDYKF